MNTPYSIHILQLFFFIIISIYNIKISSICVFDFWICKIEKMIGFLHSIAITYRAANGLGLSGF